MAGMVSIEHIALEWLYETLFQCSFVKSFSLPSDFAYQVFSVKKEVDAFVYKAESGIFEVFITGETTKRASCQHVCISVKSVEEFLSRCKQVGLEPYTVAKNEKTYVFMRDMVGNLFEIKELLA